MAASSPSSMATDAAEGETSAKKRGRGGGGGSGGSGGGSSASEDLLSSLIESLGSLSTTEPTKEELVSTFTEVLDIPEEEASFYLSSANYDLAVAVSLYLEFADKRTHEQGTRRRRMGPRHDRQIEIVGLPPGWIAHVSATRRTVFFTHVESGMEQAEYPPEEEEDGSMAASSSPPPPLVSASAFSPLPFGAAAAAHPFSAPFAGGGGSAPHAPPPLPPASGVAKESASAGPMGGSLPFGSIPEGHEPAAGATGMDAESVADATGVMGTVAAASGAAGGGAGLAAAGLGADNVDLDESL